MSRSARRAGADVSAAVVVDGRTVGQLVLTFPQTVSAGLRVARLGNSSVRYEIGLFAGDEKIAAAQGHFVHVYVGRESRRPVSLPDGLRRALHLLVP